MMKTAPTTTTTTPTPSPLSLFYSTQISYGPGGQNDKRLLEDCVFN